QLVQFYVDGTVIGVPATVQAGDGSVSFGWESWGYPNGPHTITAADCSDATTCGAQTAGVDVELNNSQPTISSPASSATVRGGFTITATFPGGALRLELDGSQLGPLGSASPYSENYRGSALTAGPHTVKATLCATDGSQCSGPSSSVAFQADVLHPAISSISPRLFSPNGDGRRDKATVTLSLPETQTVNLAILTASKKVVRHVVLGSLGSGQHTWVWNGNNDSGNRVGDGAYTVKLSSTKTISGVSVPGTASGGLSVDTHAPVMSSISGNGLTFYPVPDGFHDAFAPNVTLDSSATLTLMIYNFAGHLVRRIDASRNAGRAALTWGGRDAAGHLVPAGTYRYTFTAQDAAGNRRITGKYTVYVSLRRLVSRSVTLTKAANKFTKVGTNDISCTQYSTGLSMYSSGVWLGNVCDPDFDGAASIESFYTFVVPSAVKYGSLKLSAYGSTLYPPSEVLGAYFTTSNDVAVHFTNVRSASGEWLGLGSVPGAGRVSSDHRVRVAVGVDDGYNSGGNLSDLDMATIRLVVNYSVLR
ncbi:MAG TPA: FlgD immunoglobulin-like domain containing protein, partial [Jatrophihabitans sp.]|nr:FlgD immunoglobulin-like domain containing protein [Jatrophihabitans sp.]